MRRVTEGKPIRRCRSYDLRAGQGNVSNGSRQGRPTKRTSRRRRSRHRGWGTIIRMRGRETFWCIRALCVGNGRWRKGETEKLKISPIFNSLYV